MTTTDKATPQADNALLIDLANAVTRRECSPEFAVRQAYKLGLGQEIMEQAQATVKIFEKGDV